MTPRASAASSIDFVSDAESVRVEQVFIIWLNFSLIDFGGDYEVVRAGEANRGSRKAGAELIESRVSGMR
jgi:hypothetical protein